MAHEPESLNGVVAHLQELQETEGFGRTSASLSEAYRLQGRVEDAVRVAREAARELPRNVAVRIALARALSDAGDDEEALVAYRDALSMDPENLEALAATEGPHSAELHAVALEPPAERTQPGSLSDELSHLSELFIEPRSGAAPSGDGIATLTLAEIYARQGLFDRAVRVCEVLSERTPDDTTVAARLTEYRQRLAADREADR